MNFAWVPLPAPGGPTSTNLIRSPASPQESLVAALHELALDLLHRLKAHAHHNQHSGAAEREVHILLAVENQEEQVRQDGDHGEVERARQRDARLDEVQV